jgi:hypothetical protein
MFDLKIVTTLEVEIVIQHVGCYLDETGAQNSQKEGSKVEDMSDLKCDYSSEYYWDKRGLKEGHTHGSKPKRQERCTLDLGCWTGCQSHSPDFSRERQVGR